MITNPGRNDLIVKTTRHTVIIERGAGSIRFERKQLTELIDKLSDIEENQ